MSTVQKKSKQDTKGRWIPSLVALVILTSVGIFAWRFISSQFTTYSRSSYSKLEQTQSEVKDTISTQQAATESQAPKKLTPQEIAESMKQSEPLETPTHEKLREDIERDGSHHAPASLMSFARDLAKKMKASRESEATADEFFQELKDCVERRDVPSIQALCLTAAQKLSRIYPKFQDSYMGLRSSSSNEAKNLLEATNQLAR